MPIRLTVINESYLKYQHKQKMTQLLCVHCALLIFSDTHI